MAGVRESTQAVTPQIVRTAVGLLSRRFGKPEDKVGRLGRVRALLQSSRAFALTLDQFTGKADPHMRGEHSAADMHNEADAMAQALADWTVAIASSADTFHHCYRGEVPRECVTINPPPAGPELPRTGVRCPMLMRSVRAAG